ncbi:hypothetical protein GCM10023188_23870 [Pontibacter saemangeumensis]|uniref:Uncharacterized protein n=1 Tax=Pontibacter saemangeumensis TaxID=1084525 RepID=A0ABP8LQA5_9BACT
MQPFGQGAGHLTERTSEPKPAAAMNTLRNTLYVLLVVLRQNLYGWYALLLLLVFALLA